MLAALDRARIVAPPGFDRWRIPPAALAIHLCIGQAYAFSVFKLPLTRLVGRDHSAATDWTQLQVASVFTVAIVCLGLSAAVLGRWLERVGPRASGLAAALCWSTGFFVSAVAVEIHHFWLFVLGYGVIGGCGLGLGYITPVSTLIKWFPDRRGLATGLAIMGFGGGAFVASPASQMLMDAYATAEDLGVAATLCTLGVVYLAFMTAGAFAFRVPPPGWAPRGWTPPGSATVSPGAAAGLTVERAVRQPAFWLLWVVLLLNVSAGIGLLEQAAPLVQELFPDTVGASAAAGFVGLLSLFNMGGRFVWSSASDRIGRPATYTAFFVLGILGYAALPYAGRIAGVASFVAIAAVLMTLYGGGFATIPSYLSDLFGTRQVGAIHGRLLTAWSAAGVLGPVLVNTLRERALARGLEPRQAYELVFGVLSVMLLGGLAANLLVGRFQPRHAPTSEPAATVPTDAADTSSPMPPNATGSLPPVVRSWPTLLALWVGVALPLAWGVAMTARKAASLFG